jgi:hypothetical protein
LAFLLASSPASAQGESNWDEQFRSQMTEWIKTIATRDPQFRQWQDATTEVQTLGANQHQWLVSVLHSGKQVGYLVIGETPDPKKQTRFVLLEYGVGEFILFDDAFAPREIAAEPVYDGFSSHWLVAGDHSERMVNAKTGEAYPAAFQASAQVMNRVPAETLISLDERLTQTRILEDTAQNPFDHIGWIHQLNVNTRMTWNQLWQQPAGGVRVTLTVPLHQEQVLAPFVVGTLHLWNDSHPYVGVWDEGLRFVPFSYVDQVGKFHVNKTSSPSE